MKTIIRILAVALCIALLGVTLCSCQYLEDHKNNRAVFTDSSKESFTFRGYTYKKIEVPSKLNFVMISNDCDTAFVTTEDVPVLLSTAFGQAIYYDQKEKNPVIIHCETAESEIYYGTAYMGINYDFGKKSIEGDYVREDQYDEMKKTLENATLDHYFYWIYNDEYYYDSDWDSYESSMQVRMADDDLTKAIKDTLKNGERKVYTKFPDDEWSSMELYPCDKDMMVTNNQSLNIFTDGKGFYLVPCTNGSADTNDLVKVDKKNVKPFEKLIESDNENQFYGMMLSDYFES